MKILENPEKSQLRKALRLGNFYEEKIKRRNNTFY